MAGSRSLVVGEALTDVVHRADGTSEEHPGGSPANVALGLARLGHEVVFATQVGSDERGRLIAALLGGEGVTLTEASVTAAPTSVAQATLDATGAASYQFDITWEIAQLDLPGIGHVHTGSIAATLEPGATTVLEAVERARATATVSYDPNARPSLMGDPHEVRAKIEAIIGRSDVVKASDEDVHWLYDGAPVPDVMRLWMKLGPSVVVVTRGGGGAVVVVGPEAMSVPAPPTEVADTVGAGDSFMAGMISGLLDAGLLGSADARERLRTTALHDVLPSIERALACAAITVSRKGADPPRREEI